MAQRREFPHIALSVGGRAKENLTAGAFPGMFLGHIWGKCCSQWLRNELCFLHMVEAPLGTVLRMPGDRGSWRTGSVLPSQGPVPSQSTPERLPDRMGGLINKWHSSASPAAAGATRGDCGEQRLPGRELTSTVHGQSSVSSQLLWSLFEYAVSSAPLTSSDLALYSWIWHQKYPWNYSSRGEYPFWLSNSNAFSFKCSASPANSISIAKRQTKTKVNGGEKKNPYYWMYQTQDTWKPVSQYSEIHFCLIGPPSKLTNKHRGPHTLQ